MVKPRLETEEYFTSYNAKRMRQDLARLSTQTRIANSLESVFSIWVGKNKNNKFSRNVYARAYGSFEVEYDITLSPQDSLRRLIILFEFVESMLPDIEWSRTTESSSYVSYYATVNDVDLSFHCYITHSESCKIVPIYETKRVQVGSRTICLGDNQ